MSYDNMAYNNDSYFDKARYENARRQFSTELKNPLGVFYAAPSGQVLVNMISELPLFEGTKVAFDRGDEVCSEIKVEDYGRLCGVVIVAGHAHVAAIIAPKGLLDFSKPITRDSRW